MILVSVLRLFQIAYQKIVASSARSNRYHSSAAPQERYRPHSCQDILASHKEVSSMDVQVRGAFLFV